MSYLVVLSLGKGDWQHGFPNTIAQLWEEHHSTPMQFTGSLPAMPELDALYQQWQILYAALYSHIGWRRSIVHPEFELDSTEPTHISQAEFERLCRKLQLQLNIWLGADSFRSIDCQLRTRLTPADEIRLIIVAEPKVLRLPWCLWEFLSDYPQAEIALSPPEYSRSLQLPSAKPNRKVRILGILGNSQGIDIERDRQLLQQLPQAEIEFLIEPKASDLDRQLWQPGWDILFFAGHSSSQQQGSIYLNSHESLTIEQLKYGLRTAIARGLKLAIFNSCDGLGLARDLADLHLPQAIVMREPVPDLVAQEFLKHFLRAFAGGQPLYLAVRQAREQLQALETQFPCATWLPVICQNPAERPPTWQEWCGKSPGPVRLPTRRELQTVLCSSVAIAACVLGGRWLGLLQPLELWAFDRLMQLRPAEAPDSRLLVVTVSEQDIQAQGRELRRGSLSDGTLNQLLAQLEQAQPKAIGLDLYRDFPASQPLANRLRQHDGPVFICKRPAPPDDPSGILPPPELPEARLGFSDFLQDSDGVVRRQLMFMSPNPTSPCTTPYAFSVQLAFRYLNARGIAPSFTPAGDLQLGKVIFRHLSGRTGGYQQVDARGRQVLLNYRTAPSPQAVAPQVTLTQVLTGQVNPNAIKGRIVVVGVTNPSSGDYWSTPYGTEFSRRLPGVFIHAQMASQILSTVLDQRPLLWVWSQWGDALWVGLWTFGGGILSWRFQRLSSLGLALSVATGTLTGICFLLLLQGGWIPLIPAITSLLTTSSSVTYILYLRDE